MKHRVMTILFALATMPVFAQDAGGEHLARVGSNDLAWECRGNGPKTVLLIEGMGLDAHATFKNTFRNFTASGYQICLYDRAGVGHSTPQKAARPLAALTEELDGLIKERQWRDVVLVAHSFGGLVARGFAQEHPNAVKGIVFVDCVHESWYPAMKKAMSPAGWGTMEMIINWEKNTHSHEDFAEAVQALTGKTTALKMPVTVISRGIPHTGIRQAKMSYEDVDAFNTTWDAAQFDLAKVSSDMRHVRMRYASHLYDEQDPWFVIEEIGMLLDRVQAAPKS
jgi:pimeloyl-ACP methyl ester carboxylesterase